MNADAIADVKNVLVIDSPRSDYLDGLTIERAVLGDGCLVELCRVRDESEIDGRLEDAEAVISWYPIALNSPSLDRMKRCKGIVRAAVGYDNIDIAYARSLGIPVANVPDYGTEEVADHTLALLLAMVRNLRVTDAAAKRDIWDWRTIGKVSRVRNLCLGIIGFGRIGMAVSQRARSFGMRCVFYDPFLLPGIEKALGVERALSLLDLLANCNVASIHTPSTSATRGLIGARELRAMPPDGLLINTARGDVVRQSALIEHLASHPHFRAALDVLSEEPQIPPALRDSEQVVLTSHSAFYSDASLVEMRFKSATAAKLFLMDETIQTVVN